MECGPTIISGLTSFPIYCLPEPAKSFGSVTDIIWAGFNITVIIMAMQVYQKMQRFLGESAVLKIPLHVIFLIVPLGFTLLTLRLIQGLHSGRAFWGVGY